MDLWGMLECVITPALNNDQRSLVRRAFHLATARHEGQLRQGGQQYICHPVRVAIACATYAIRAAWDSATTANLVASALLHDVIEDTATTEAEIAQAFGQEVARVVRAVSHEDEEEPDEVFLGRVASGGGLPILVKRFDKLDNVVSLAQAPEEFRLRKIAETRAALPIWQRMDPEGAREIEAALCALQI